MSVRSILIHPEALLRKKCQPVDQIDSDVLKLMDDMLDTMYDAPGIGLAAPQISVLRRVIVVDCAEKDEPPAPICMANPEVISFSEEKKTREEGCLSIPGEYADITRPQSVTVRYLDREGSAKECLFTDLWATCIQHEIDHLDGKLFIDYLGPVRRSVITRKMQKLKREQKREKISSGRKSL